MARLDNRYLSAHTERSARRALRDGRVKECGTNPNTGAGEIPFELDDGSIWYFTKEEYATARGPLSNSTPKPDACPNCHGSLKRLVDSDGWRCEVCGKTWLDSYFSDYDPAPPPPPSEPEETIHILHQGSPLCRFTSERPVNWPEGHTWVPMAQDMEHVQLKGRQGTKVCNGCAKEGPPLFQKLFRS